MINIVKTYKVNKNATLPFKGTQLSACYDICACLHTETIKFHGRSEPVKVDNFGTDDAFIRLHPDDMALIPTGLIFCLPETHHLKFYSRSGNVWKRMLAVANQPAVIDSDYVLESFVLLYNRSIIPQRIKTGDAIAQCEICKNNTIIFSELNKIGFDEIRNHINESSSRIGGFGSTSK